MSQQLHIQKLSVLYGRKTIISELDLPVFEPGSLVAVVGPNGAGKSTLLKGLAGLETATGKVELGGRDLTQLPLRERAAQVAYLPQTLPQPTTLSAYESVLSLCRATDMPRVELETRIERMFDELEITNLALRPLQQLSGGQRQMVGLAQILVRQPPLLLLDEPTSALDLRWQLKVLQATRSQLAHQGNIALMAIHDLNLALRFADQMIVLSPEGLRAAGTPGAVMTPAVCRDTYGIEGRVETCSLGHPIVVIDGLTP